MGPINFRPLLWAGTFAGIALGVALTIGALLLIWL
jgi:hypothetical protein